MATQAAVMQLQVRPIAAIVHLEVGGMLRVVLHFHGSTYRRLLQILMTQEWCCLILAIGRYIFQF